MLIEQITGKNESGKPKILTIADLKLINSVTKSEELVKCVSSTSAVCTDIIPIPGCEKTLITLEFPKFEELKKTHETFLDWLRISGKCEPGVVPMAFLTLWPIDPEIDEYLEAYAPWSNNSEPTDEGEASKNLYLTFDDVKIKAHKKGASSINIDDYEFPDDFEDYVDDDTENDGEDYADYLEDYSEDYTGDDDEDESEADDLYD